MAFSKKTWYKMQQEKKKLPKKEELTEFEIRMRALK